MAFALLFLLSFFLAAAEAFLSSSPGAERIATWGGGQCRKSSTPLIVRLSMGGKKGTSQPEQELLDAIAAAGQGRGSEGGSDQRVEKAVAALEETGGSPISSAVDGKWRLLFTVSKGKASPIQKSFVAVKAFQIYQTIDIFGERPPTVANIVDFGGKLGELKVEAIASCQAKPLPGFKPRKGDGRILGLELFGVSETKVPPNPERRIDFKFDNAGFDLKPLPFRIPYPVPFSILGDEVKGWIDVTYLSPKGTLRLSRGNKGTLFILQRVEDED